MQSTYRHTRRACYLGYLTQGIVNSLAPLLFTVFQTDYQISFAQLGQLILLNFGTQLCMDFFLSVLLTGSESGTASSVPI